MQTLFGNNLVSLEKIASFLFAGKAIFTIRSSKTGKHFTYRITRCKDKEKELYFVGLLCGTDNTNHYNFFATIFGKNAYKHGTKSKIKEDALGVQAFRWFLRNLKQNALNGQVTIHYEGRCGKCGKRLTTPESTKLGFGPECAKMLDIK